jgi:PAS domain S-box-containing protein
MLGYTENELRQKTFQELTHPEDLPQNLDEVRRMLAGDIPRMQAEKRYLHKDGHYVWAHLNASLVRSTGGEPMHFIAQIEDISERKRAEAQRTFSEKKFSLAFNASPDAMAITERETGIFIDVNEAFTTWSGYSRQELIGHSTKALGFWACPGDRERVVAGLESGSGTVEITSLAKVKNGGLRNVVFLASTLAIDGRNYFLSLTHDITETLRLDKERQLSISLLQATLESTADGILVVDREGRVTSYNQRFLRMWDIPEALAAEQDDARLLDFVLNQLAEPEAFLAKVRGLYAHPEAESFDTLEFKDGRVFERYSRPQRLADNIVGRVWSFRDVAQRVRAEEERARLLESERKARAEAETANKAKDDFLAIVSHELRTPLTAILGWSWLLRSGQLAEEERQNALDIILRNMQSQRQIVEDLIDVSSLSRGQFNLTRKTFELSAVLESVCESLGQLAQSRGMRLVRDLQGPAGVVGDSGRLQQVFWNLLHNAMKFTPDAGEVRMSLRREEDQVVVEVQDRGQGIPPDFLPHVFEPFRQGEDPLIREHRGLGLGLAIVKRLVELHGGTVSAASAGAGRGATFTVRLPAAAWPPPGQDAPAPRTGPDSHRLDGLSILVVEDEADARQLLEQLLTRYGAQVAVAADADEALARLGQDVPDLLLCDIALPGEDGCSLLRKVRARGGKLGAVPAAALTALAREEDRVRALTAGFQLYLTKPIEPVQILEALRALVGRN